MLTILIEILLISFLGSLCPVSARSAESGWSEAGVRIGIQASSRRVYFRQYDAFAEYRLPMDWRDSSGWGISPHVNVSLGALNGGDETGFIGSGGSALVLDKHGSGFTTDLGININLLDRRHIGSMDFGSILQFGAYLGINYRFDNGLKIGYRLQHISNGHIIYPDNTPNPGLDMHMFGTSYVF